MNLKVILTLFFSISSSLVLHTQITEDWKATLAGFDVCSTSEYDTLLKPFFSLKKNYILSVVEDYEKEIVKRVHDCINIKNDSIAKVIKHKIFALKFNTLPYSVDEKEELCQTFISSFQNSSDNLNASDSIQFSSFYLFLGVAFQSNGYPSKALNTYSKSLQYLPVNSKISTTESLMSTRLYRFFANIDHFPSSQNIREFHELKTIFKIVYENDLDGEQYFLGKLNLYASRHFSNFHQQDSALYYLNLVPKDLTIGDLPRNRAKSQSIYYLTFNKLDEYKKSLRQQAMYSRQMNGDSYIEETELARIHLKQKQLLEADRLYNSALSQITRTDGDVKSVKDNQIYAQILLGLAEISLIKKDPEEAYLLLQDTRSLILDKLSSSEFQNDKIKFLTSYTKLIQLLLTNKNVLSLSTNEQLLLIEESKSLALYDEIVRNSILKNDLGEDRYKRLKSFQDSTSTIQRKLTFNKISASERLALENKKISFNDSISSLKQMSDFNDFRQQDIDALISEYPNTTVVQYFTTDTFAIVFVLNDGDVIAKEFEYSPQIEKTIDEFNLSIRNYKSSIHSIDSLSSILYKILIDPIKDKLKNDLLIIPYNKISSIPFECLKATNDVYMVEQHDIAYAFSLSVNAEMKKPRQSQNNFLGFAPTYTSRLDGYSFSELEENVEELRHVSSFYSNPVLYQGVDATKKKFKEKIKEADIVHISAHADIHPKDNSYAYIAFTDASGVTDSSLLYLEELYNLDLNLDMLVLSACNTGIGNYRTGEGIISIARGFTYAGAKSLISTLWNVNETSTREITSDFYTLISKGHSKAKSLAHSKRKYLKTNSKRNSHPYYWSGIILIGDTTNIYGHQQKRSHYIYIIASLIFFWALKSFIESIGQKDN